MAYQSKKSKLDDKFKALIDTKLTKDQIIKLNNHIFKHNINKKIYDFLIGIGGTCVIPYLKMFKGLTIYNIPTRNYQSILVVKEREEFFNTVLDIMDNDNKKQDKSYEISFELHPNIKNIISINKIPNFDNLTTNEIIDYIIEHYDSIYNTNNFAYTSNINNLYIFNNLFIFSIKDKQYDMNYNFELVIPERIDIILDSTINVLVADKKKMYAQYKCIEDDCIKTSEILNDLRIKKDKIIELTYKYNDNSNNNTSIKSPFKKETQNNGNDIQSY